MFCCLSLSWLWHWQDDAPMEGLEEGFMDVNFNDDKNSGSSWPAPSRRIASDSGIRPTVPPLTSSHSTGGMPTATAMATAGGTGGGTGALQGLLPPPPDSLRTLANRKQCSSYDTGLQQLRSRGNSAADPPPLLPPPPSTLPTENGDEGPKDGATVRIRGLRVRKSREERGALERQGSSTASGGGGGAGTRDEELPHALKVKVKPHPPAEGVEHAAMILLPLDYSGMADEEGEGLLKAMDVQVKNALQAQVNIAQSVDAFLTVLHM